MPRVSCTSDRSGAGLWGGERLAIGRVLARGQCGAFELAGFCESLGHTQRERFRANSRRPGSSGTAQWLPRR